MVKKHFQAKVVLGAFYFLKSFSKFASPQKKFFLMIGRDMHMLAHTHR